MNSEVLSVIIPVILIAGFIMYLFNWGNKTTPPIKNASFNSNLNVKPDYHHQNTSNVKLIDSGGYVASANSNYYNLLLFESDGTCKKATIHKSQEYNPGGVIFITLIQAGMKLAGNNGFWRYNPAKAEIVVNFNLDPQHEQTYVCKLKSNGNLIADIHYRNSSTGIIEKGIREYCFEKDFKSKFIL